MNPRRVYIETYGCQMNEADTEVVGGILHSRGYALTREIREADVVLLNTCAVRDNAEQRIHGRLGYINTFRRQNPSLVVGILGCMAERLRERFITEERMADLVVGPDEYRKLPDLMDRAFGGEKGIAVRLSRVENYEDIEPLRTEGISAWLSVMRGCDKFCSFCVVPFTRGRERSRSLDSIVDEVARLSARGFREVTLLGQNVNSYRDGERDFADLMGAVAVADPSMRIRFTTSHPQDLSDRLIDTIAGHDNICKYVHLPVQSGSDRILALMHRSYTAGYYLDLVERLRRRIPGVSLTTDIISGFPTETEKDHRHTLELMRTVRFEGAYTFKYSPREGTRAWEMQDDVPEGVKGRRVAEVTTLQHEISLEINSALVGSVAQVLVEGPSRKSDADLTGRTDTNRSVVFPRDGVSPGELADIRIHRVNSATLFGTRLLSPEAHA